MAIWIGWTPKGGKAVGADPFPPFGWKPSNFWDKRSRDYLNWRIGSPSTVECSWCTEGQYGTPFLGSLQFSTILKVDMLGDILVVLSDFGQLRRRSSLTVELVFLRSSSHSTSPGPTRVLLFWHLFRGSGRKYKTWRGRQKTFPIPYWCCRPCFLYVFCHCCLQTGQPVPSHDLIVYIWFQDSETSSWRMGTNSTNRTGMSWKMAFLIEWAQFFGKTPNYKISGL